MRNDIAVAINLDRDISRCVGFVNLRACAVLALHAHIPDLVQAIIARRFVTILLSIGMQSGQTRLSTSRFKPST